MKSINVFQTKYLTTSSDLFQLGALCENQISDKIDKDWIWLEFKEIKDEEFPDQQLIWDNSSYLFETFYPFLLRKLNHKLKKEDYIEFADILSYLNEGNVKESTSKTTDLIELLETAKQLNWYE